MKRSTALPVAMTVARPHACATAALERQMTQQHVSAADHSAPLHPAHTTGSGRVPVPPGICSPPEFRPLCMAGVQALFQPGMSAAARMRERPRRPPDQRVVLVHTAPVSAPACLFLPYNMFPHAVAATRRAREPSFVHDKPGALQRCCYWPTHSAHQEAKGQKRGKEPQLKLCKNTPPAARGRPCKHCMVRVPQAHVAFCFPHSNQHQHSPFYAGCSMLQPPMSLLHATACWELSQRAVQHIVALPFLANPLGCKPHRWVVCQARHPPTPCCCKDSHKVAAGGAMLAAHVCH